MSKPTQAAPQAQDRPIQAQTRSIPSLDGLRGIAVMMVVAAHLAVFPSLEHHFLKHGPHGLAFLFGIDPGDLGVSTFFVISGFLITTLLIRADDASGRPSLTNFYLRRMFRIFPPFYFYLAVVAILYGLHRVPMLLGAFVSAATYTSNYYPYWLSQPSGAGWLVAHTWSLSLEEQFYLFWPAALHFLGRKRAAWLGVAVLLLAPVSRVVTFHLWPEFVYSGQLTRMFHTRLDTIVAGCVLALLGTWPGVYQRVIGLVNRSWTGAIAAVLLYADLYLSNRSAAMNWWAGLSLEAVLLAFLLLYSIAHAGGPIGRLLNLAPLRHIGVISYGLYLWQQLFDGPVDLFPGHRLVKLVLILVAAEVSYVLVERPSYRVRDWLLRRRTLAGGRQAEVVGGG